MDSLESTGQFEIISALAVPIFITSYLEIYIKIGPKHKNYLEGKLEHS